MDRSLDQLGFDDRTNLGSLTGSIWDCWPNQLGFDDRINWVSISGQIWDCWPDQFGTDDRMTGVSISVPIWDCWPNQFGIADRINCGSITGSAWVWWPDQFGIVVRTKLIYLLIFKSINRSILSLWADTFEIDERIMIIISELVSNSFGFISRYYRILLIKSTYIYFYWIFLQILTMWFVQCMINPLIYRVNKKKCD